MLVELFYVFPVNHNEYNTVVFPPRPSFHRDPP